MPAFIINATHALLLTLLDARGKSLPCTHHSREPDSLGERECVRLAQGRIQEIEFGGVQAVFAGADAGLGVRAHKPR